jgi:plastocyanin
MKIGRNLIVLILLVLLSGLFSCSKSDNSSYNGDNPNGSGALIYITSSMAYSPTVVTVKKGTRVTWRNNGTSIHTATSNDGTTFNSGDILIGGNYSITANVVGTFTYHCTHHSNMTGELRVTE